MGSSLSTAGLMPPQSMPPTSTTMSSLSSSASSSSASSHGSFAANNAADAGYRSEYGGRFGGFYGTNAGGGSHLPRLLPGKSVGASTHSPRRNFACSYGCERYGCNCTDEGLGTDYYGCCECERAETAVLNSPYGCCDHDYLKGNEQRDDSLASAFALFVKRSQRNVDDRCQHKQTNAYDNRTKIRRSRDNAHCVANIVAHGRNALSSAGEGGRDSGFNSGATSARSADSSNGDDRSRNVLLWNISQRFSVEDERTLREIRASMRQKAAADDGRRNSNDKHITSKADTASKDGEYGSAAALAAALASLRVESGGPRAEASAALPSSVFDTKTLETYQYERPLIPATNDIDAARYGTSTVAETRRAKTLKKGAQSGFFATQYAKLAEKRISIGRWANFASSSQQKSAASVPRSAAALSQTKNRSKTTTSLLGNVANRQQQEFSQLNAKPTTKRPMTATGERSDRAARHQRSSLMSVLPTSFSAYRLAGLLGGASGRLATREKPAAADPEDVQAPSSQDGKRPLSWTGSLADSVLSGSGAALSRPSSSYSTAGWDSGFYGDANNTNCINNGMVHYDGRLKRSTLTTATSGYGSFSERLASPEPDYGSPAGNCNAEEQQRGDEYYDTVPEEARTGHRRRQSAAMSKSVCSGFDATKSIHDQAYHSSKTGSKNNNRHSLPSISRGAIKFTSSFEKDTRTVPLANGLFIDSNSQISKSDQNNNKINCCDKNVDGGEKTIIQASTSELLQALSIFISEKFGGIRHFDASHVVTWMRAVDRALIVQGWQDIAFINPANLVFVYMLIREHFRSADDSIQQIVTVNDIQALVLTCLYISYSYMGNEISYPLKPFIAETADRVEFWQRCVSIANAHSASMLRLNSSSAFFLDVFTELKTIYSVE